jgi:hypothetical protein
VLVCPRTVALVLAMMADPLSQRRFSPRPAQARLPAGGPARAMDHLGE